MAHFRSNTVADTCDTFKLISIKTKDNGNAVATFAPCGERGSTVMQVLDNGMSDPSYGINTDKGIVAPNVSMGCSLLAALAGKDGKYADAIEASFYEHLDAQLTLNTNERTPFNWEERFAKYKGMVLHVDVTPSCVERNGYINFADFDVSEVQYADRANHLTDIFKMFSPADEDAITMFAENQKASKPAKRKPVVSRG